MASGNDMKAANQTYGSFIGLLKVATPVIALIAAIVIIIIQ